MVEIYKKGCFLAILLLLSISVILYFSFDDISGQLSPEDQALFEQSAKNAEKSLEEKKILAFVPDHLEPKNASDLTIKFNAKSIINPDPSLAESGILEVKSVKVQVNKDSQICPNNNCKLSVKNPRFYFWDDMSSGVYNLVGALVVTTSEGGKIRERLHEFNINGEISESIKSPTETTDILDCYGDLFPPPQKAETRIDLAMRVCSIVKKGDSFVFSAVMEPEQKGLLESIFGW